MSVRHYSELIAWQKSVDLTEAVYRATEEFPKREIYGLANQMRRAAVSIPSNIAEGQARRTTKDFLQFLSISRGSLQELETQIIIASRLGLFSESICQNLMERTAEIARITNGLISSLTTDH